MNTKIKPNVLLTALNRIFAERRARNQAYSLRSFAASLGVSSGALSQILAGKRRVTPKTGLRLIDCLQLPQTEAREIMQSIKKPKSSQVVFQDIDQETFAFVSQWYHFAILTLGDLSSSVWDADWLSKRLHVPRQQICEAMDRLERLGLVDLNGGKYRQTSGALSASYDIPCEAVREAHRVLLDRARDSLSQHSVDEREFSAITVAINSQRLPEIKRLIKEFRRKLAGMLTDSSPDRLYALTVNFFPLDVGSSHKESKNN